MNRDMDNGVEGVSVTGQVNESQEQGKACNNMVVDICIPENVESRCSIPCSSVTINSLTTESVEKSSPLVSNTVELSHMKTNGHEVEEVPNTFIACENSLTLGTRKHSETNHGEICESPEENSTCIDETHCRKISRICESSDVSLDLIKDNAEHSDEELLHGKSLDSDETNDGSRPLIQIVEASPPPKEDETGDVCKTCSPVEKQSQMAMEENIPSSSKDLASKNEISQAVLPQERSLSISPNKKLLVLDVNGLLADIVFFDVSCERKPDTIISSKAVFTRPFCKDFLDFCFTHFNVGIWTSRTKRNVESILDFLLGESKHKLLFCWDQYHCTDSGFGTIEDRNKPLIVKKLKKLWEKHDPNLPWEKGQFNESNTLLLDDTPHKALCNPPHTAIFPESFRYTHVNDTSLGPEGELRGYLKGLAEAENVQKYVKENPFGQRAITERNLSWRYYQKVIAACSSSSSSSSTSEATTRNRYASFNSKAFTEAVPYNRHASYNWRDNSGNRYENSQWKANHSSLGLEATRYSHGSGDSEAASYSRHGGGGSDYYRNSNNKNNSYSSFSEAVPFRQQRRSFHAAAYNSSSAASEGNGYTRGNSFHWKATNASTPSSSEAIPPDNRHGSRSHHYTTPHFSSNGRQDIPERRRWTSTNALPPSEGIPDRHRSYHYEATR